MSEIDWTIPGRGDQEHGKDPAPTMTPEDLPQWPRLDDLREKADPDHPDVGPIHELLMAVHDGMNSAADAIELQRKALRAVIDEVEDLKEALQAARRFNVGQAIATAGILVLIFALASHVLP